MSVTAVPVTPPSSSTRLWLWLGLVVAIAAALGLAYMGTRAAVAAKGTDEQFLAWNKGQSGVKTTASGLQYQILVAGDGPTLQEGDMANVTVKGTMRDGKVFQPEITTPFQIKDGATIKGFTEALRLMHKGSKYRFWVPSKLAYDDAPAGGPADQIKGKVLIFDIEVMDVKTAAEVLLMQQQQEQMQQQMMEAQGAGNASEAAPEADAKPKK